MLDDVKAFRNKFGLGCPTVPQLLCEAAFELRSTLIDEELREFKEAHDIGDLAEAADALVDLVYVVLGTAIEMGLPWDELWKDVQRANMDKIRATSSEESKRGSAMDVIKPVGWKPPQGARIIERAVRRYERTAAARDEMQLELRTEGGLQP